MTLEEFVEEMMAMGKEVVGLGSKRIDELRQFYDKVGELSRLLGEMRFSGELSPREFNYFEDRLAMIMDTVRDAYGIGKRAVDALYKFLVDIGSLLEK
jgi:hypothetical protein